MQSCRISEYDWICLRVNTSCMITQVDFKYGEVNVRMLQELNKDTAWDLIVGFLYSLPCVSRQGIVVNLKLRLYLKPRLSLYPYFLLSAW